MEGVKSDVVELISHQKGKCGKKFGGIIVWIEVEGSEKAYYGAKAKSK